MGDRRPPYSFTFECSLCLENVKVSKCYPAGGSAICPSCASGAVVPRLLNALKFEAKYPAKWGNQVVYPEDYADLLPEGFVAKLRIKEREYNTLIRERLYCKHKVFLSDGTSYKVAQKAWMNAKPPRMGVPIGTLRIPRASVDTCRSEPTRVCDIFAGKRSWRYGKQCECTGWMCARCGAPCDEQYPDDCRYEPCCVAAKASDTPQTSEASKDYDGLVRGRDYQLCPGAGCGFPVYLGSGCNHMVCPSVACETQFCFICGLEAHADSHHWATGKQCPRFNQPGDENAEHDRVLEPVHPHTLLHSRLQSVNAQLNTVEPGDPIGTWRETVTAVWAIGAAEQARLQPEV